MGDYVAEMRRLVGSRPLLLAAAGVIVESPEGAVLLQRRTDDGSWGLPGGALELGESLEDAARRELREETGLVAGELRLLDVYSGPEFFVRYPNGDEAFVVGATFSAGMLEGQVAQPDGHEASEVAYFALSEPPSAMSPLNRTLLARCRHLL